MEGLRNDVCNFEMKAATVHLNQPVHLAFDLALNQGGPGFSRSQALRDQVARFSVPACGLFLHKVEYDWEKIEI